MLHTDTEYQVQVAAYTRKGDGERSRPRKVRTKEAGSFYWLSEWSIVISALYDLSDGSDIMISTCMTLKHRVTLAGMLLKSNRTECNFILWTSSNCYFNADWLDGTLTVRAYLIYRDNNQCSFSFKCYFIGRFSSDISLHTQHNINQ